MMPSPASMFDDHDCGWIPTWLAAPDNYQRVQWVGAQGVIRTGVYVDGWFQTDHSAVLLVTARPIVWRPSRAKEAR